MDSQGASFNPNRNEGAFRRHREAEGNRISWTSPGMKRKMCTKTYGRGAQRGVRLVTTENGRSLPVVWRHYKIFKKRNRNIKIISRQIAISSLKKKPQSGQSSEVFKRFSLDPGQNALPPISISKPKRLSSSQKCFARLCYQDEAFVAAKTDIASWKTTSLASSFHPSALWKLKYSASTTRSSSNSTQVLQAKGKS